MTDERPKPGSRRELEEFLATAPEGLRDWAQEQLAHVEDPDAVGIEDFDDGEEDPALSPVPTVRKSRNKVNLVLVALLVAAIVVIVQLVGRPSNQTQMPENHPDISSTGAAANQIDNGRVSELKDRLESNPEDLDALRDLGKTYFDAELYQDAITYFSRALKIAPDDVEVLLSLGVAEYSTNDYDAAETHWKKAAQVHPEGAEPWYNLGFCYLAKTPPDYDSAEAAWNKVIELDPESEMAQSVKQHLASLHDSEESPTPGR